MTPNIRRNKLAKPPVKVACLACRSSRTRCDGKPICTSCVNKKRTCSYTKSHRGGPRVPRNGYVRKQKQPSNSDRSTSSNGDTGSQAVGQWINSDETMYLDFVKPMILPGAGLKDLDSDHMFDRLFGTGSNIGNDDPEDLNNTLQVDSSGPVLRCYGSDKDILNGYYTFIHPYFPILPPPDCPVAVDCPQIHGRESFQPSSPISLAISTVLALIPHPDDANPTRAESVLLRRRQAQLLAQSTMESIEIESEVLASITSPDQALSSDPPPFHRESFHPRVPVDLESILAYLILSIYEYAQRGNLTKMRNRASQAYDAATRLSLHEEGDENGIDMFTEARRRAWWMTYTCVLQSSIVSSTPPSIPIDFQHFSTPFPTLQSDTEAWSAFLNSQQMILKCTQFTVQLKKALQANTDLSNIHTKMLALDKEIDSVITKYAWNLDYPSTIVVDSNELVVAKALKAQGQIKLNSARIKLHRYNAFSDTPIFTQKHCDLVPTRDVTTISTPACSCSSLYQQSPLFTHDTGAGSSPAPSSSSWPSVGQGSDAPHSSIFSAKVCMKAALAISRAFESLPYPNPTHIANYWPPTFLSETSSTPAPRMMPAFACCAMQSSYALLMLCHRTHNTTHDGGHHPDMGSAIDELFAGLQRVLGALSNYSIVFEALGGMRDQIRGALESAKQAHELSLFLDLKPHWS